MNKELNIEKVEAKLNLLFEHIEGLIKYNNIGLEYILGNIDTEILINRKIEALYYVFPLIEKMILII